MTVRLRALERADLAFVHDLTNDRRIMSYWFDEPFESLVELHEIYARHVHDQRERRFVIVDTGGAGDGGTGGDTGDTGAGDTDGAGGEERVGVVELVEIDYIHRSTEFQIIVAPAHQGRGHASAATRMALDYAFSILNLHKVYLVVSTENRGAIRIYERAGFTVEGTLREEFFADGAYRDALRMSILQREFLPATPGA